MDLTLIETPELFFSALKKEHKLGVITAEFDSNQHIYWTGDDEQEVFESFISFVKENNQKNIFADVTIINPRMLIVDDLEAYISEDTYRFKDIKNAIDKHNFWLRKQPEQVVESIEVFFSSEGTIYSCMLESEWYREHEDELIPEMDYVELISEEISGPEGIEKQAEINRAKREAQEHEAKDKLKELEEALLKDKFFGQVSPKAARQIYVEEKAEELGISDYLPRHYHFSAVVDLIWSKYKSKHNM